MELVLSGVAYCRRTEEGVVVLETSEPKKPLRERVIRQLMNLLEWSPVDKALLIAGTTAVFVFFVVASFQPLLRNPEKAPYMNGPNLVLFMKALLGMNVVWAAIMAWGFAIRRRDPQNRAVVVATIVFYSCTYGLGAYCTGPFTSPYAGLVFVGGTFVAMLLFEIRDAMIGVTIGSVIIIATTVAERMELIPYSPLLHTSPYENGRLSGLWFGAMGGAFLFIMIECIVLSVYIVKRWRDREEALAEAYIMLRESKDRLVRAEALASLGSLVTGAAHELRNPLASSGSILQTLGDEIQGSQTLPVDDRQAVTGMLELAMKGHNRASAIVNRLYEFTECMGQDAAGSPLSTVIERLRKKFPGADIQCTPEAAGRPVGARRLELLLSNLLENAVRSGSKNPVRLSVDTKGERLRFDIEDTGRGIPATAHQDLFKPFFTLEKGGEGHGIGLGLYIVHELVTQGGGTVTLQSEPDRGTRVIVVV